MMVRKILILLILLSSNFNLMAQSHLHQEFYDRLPIRIGNGETYFKLTMPEYQIIPEGVPVFMPKNIKKLTIYKWNTRSEYGRIVQTSVRSTIYATYKEGKLRTLRNEGDNLISQYEYDENIPIKKTIYYINSGEYYHSTTQCYHSFIPIGNSYIVDMKDHINFFFSSISLSVVDTNCCGNYFNISNCGTYCKIIRTRWDCSKSYFIKNFGGISTYNVCKKGFDAVVDYAYKGGLYKLVKDSGIRTGVSISYINAIGLPTDIDAVECIRAGWLSQNKYYYTYDYE